MRHDSVKTEVRAREILVGEAERLKKEHGTIMEMYHRYPDTQCECGDTMSLQLLIRYSDGCDEYLSCAICDSCGDDDALPEDVIY